jgi:hypothetical protein
VPLQMASAVLGTSLTAVFQMRNNPIDSPSVSRWGSGRAMASASALQYGVALSSVYHRTCRRNAPGCAEAPYLEFSRISEEGVRAP